MLPLFFAGRLYALMTSCWGYEEATRPRFEAVLAKLIVYAADPQLMTHYAADPPKYTKAKKQKTEGAGEVMTGKNQYFAVEDVEAEILRENPHFRRGSIIIKADVAKLAPPLAKGNCALAKGAAASLYYRPALCTSGAQADAGAEAEAEPSDPAQGREVRAASRSTAPQWGLIRFRLAPRTYDAPTCGPSVRAVPDRLTKSRKKYPPEKHYHYRLLSCP